MYLDRGEIIPDQCAVEMTDLQACVGNINEVLRFIAFCN